VCVYLYVHLYICTYIQMYLQYVCIHKYTDHMKFYCFFHILFGSIVCYCIYGCTLSMLLFNFVYYIFLLLCSCILIVIMFFSRYCVSLCCSVYCLCVIVYCTTATGCQPNSSYQIYHTINAYSNDDISMFRYSGDIVPNSWSPQNITMF
jgi:hypothetical protein